MAFWRVIILAFTASIFVEAKWFQRQKREMTDICDPAFSNTTKIQCYCILDSHKDIVQSAECHLAAKGVEADDKSWEGFEKLKNATKLTLSNTRGIVLPYIPTSAIKNLHSLIKLNIKYGNIDKIEAFAFANLSVVEEITLSDNQIETLARNAFAHHSDLTVIGLDSNEIVEINRNVFVDLPSLEKLYLTNNKITTIHDKAFIHLSNLREMEIDRNNIFSLNSETFSGLRKLQKLDLSSNALEVIGDNTFLPLINLRTLNLDGNKIQMLDERAFHGLGRLYALSLAHNNLTNIENVRILEHLDNLSQLSLKSNQLVELKAELIAPILTNFYTNYSTLDVEDNNFPCACHLEWFMGLMNNTRNKHLKLSIENLKCTPSDSLREQWSRAEVTEKPEEEEAPAGDYEYYDDSQLNGKLFYIDIRELANCTKNEIPAANNEIVHKPNVEVTTKTTTKATTPSPTTQKVTTTEVATTKVTTSLKPETSKPKEEAKPKETFTTVRLATVSAKPVEHNNNIFDHDMASDEARPERIKAHRSIADEDTPKDVPNHKANAAHANISSVIVISIMLFIRLCF
ncbi:uncharacterized protein LOC142977199 [Anticarsia gemmatalis]|uniref:uncharacterized protein LOC142977199 n=1 Tax=Anticarsia gemmatalis TaxID=129554 RepID=UPI003F769173